MRHVFIDFDYIFSEYWQNDKWIFAFESIKIFRVKIDWNCNFVG